MVHYEVVQQLQYWAVRRIGPRGGIRFIASYTDQGHALTVCACLNSYASSEVA